MGTRALVKIKDRGNVLSTVYRQNDGYPDGLGQEIKKILNGGKSRIINGISGQSSPAYFNGMGCLGAYLIGELKEGIGGVCRSSLKRKGYRIPPHV